MKYRLAYGVIFSAALGCSFSVNSKTSISEPQPSQAALENLGQQIFFDTRLSEPQGQSCASCHNPQHAYAHKDVSVSPGATPRLLGKRNAPSLSYSSLTPAWHFNNEDETWIGGFFIDGRALTLEEQALGPLLDPLEMALPSKVILAQRIKSGPYAKVLESLYGAELWQDSDNVATLIAKSLVAFQSSDSFTPRFTSKYDAYLRGKTQLTPQETRGLQLYEAEDKGNCAACHQSQRGENGEWPLFTDFSYDNLGLPKNPELAFLKASAEHNPLGENFVDRGLADNPNILDSLAQLGKFKVPTLRNITVTGPYMHNSLFSDLTEAVEFYNSRDIEEKWSTPEIAENVNKDELGDLKLTSQEVEDIVVFLGTLTDGWSQ